MQHSLVPYGCHCIDVIEKDGEPCLDFLRFFLLDILQTYKRSHEQIRLHSKILSFIVRIFIGFLGNLLGACLYMDVSYDGMRGRTATRFYRCARAFKQTSPFDWFFWLILHNDMANEG